ncbi:MAG: hypothetical protein QG639_452 [Patescibacteria group bacterium]|nr:hypothetical protein [Patescibacteria group bacterium]
MWDKKSAESVVVLLQRTQLSLFRSSSGKILNLPFDPTIVQDLEVLNEDVFCKQLSVFLQQQKLQKASIILLLDSSIYFSQKVEPVNPDMELKAKLETDAKNIALEEKVDKVSLTSELENKKKIFAQSVPFANVFSSLIVIGKEKFFVALNRDFYEPVVKIFSEKDLRVVSILPLAVVSPLFGTSGFTPEAATAVIKSVDKLRTHDLLGNSIKTDAPIVSTALPSDPSDKKRLVLMSVLFLVLIGVLVAVILWSRQRDQQLTVPPVMSPPVIETTPGPTAPPQEIVDSPVSIQSSQILEDAIPIQIIDASGGATSSALLQQQLTEAGYLGVTVVPGATTITGPVVISYTDTPPLDLVESVANELESLGYNTRLEEVEDADVSLVITLTNQ